jgi:hypothetical protein
VSFQSPVSGGTVKINCEAVGMCLQAGAVMNAKTSDCSGDVMCFL